MKKFIFYIAILSFYACGALSAITINNQDISTLVKLDEFLVYEIPDADNIVIRIKNGNIEIFSLKLTNVADIQAFFNELNNRKNELCQKISRGAFSFNSGAHVSLKGAYISGDEGIFINARTTIEIEAAILKSNQKIVFNTNQFKTDGCCFVDAPWLQIESNLPTTLCQIIHFVFNKNISFPASIQGHINFENNEIDILAVGASKIKISFAPQAFENTQNANNAQ